MSKLPKSGPTDIVEGTECTKPGPIPGKLIKTGLRVSIAAWTFTPTYQNLWNLAVDSHFAIKVEFPDGQVFYFDKGDWGGVFRPNQIPGYAK
jgi:hypothetical protein